VIPGKKNEAPSPKNAKKNCSGAACASQARKDLNMIQRCSKRMGCNGRSASQIHKDFGPEKKNGAPQKKMQWGSLSIAG
jgi:hypothetical protein